MRPELIVAEKEFRDHITSKRFALLLGILLLLALYTINGGMDAYNLKLDAYKNPQNTIDYASHQREIDRYEQLIEAAREAGQPPGVIESLQYDLDMMRRPAMPSVLDVFQSTVLLFAFVGMILGASLGFDQIARERDEGSLKLLAACPAGRGTIINGKAIAAITALACAIGAVFALAIAIVMLKGVVPDTEDLARLFLAFLASLLYCSLFFALAMIVSALAKNTSLAAIGTVGLLLCLFMLTVLASFLANALASGIAGPPPDFRVSPIAINITDNNGATYTENVFDDTAIRTYSDRYGSAYTRIDETLSALLPFDGFSDISGYGHLGIGPALITRYRSSAWYGSGPISSGEKDTISLLDTLASIWLKLLIIAAETIAAFGVAYLAFTRTDIR